MLHFQWQPLCLGYYPELDGKEGWGLQRQKPHAFHMIVQVHGSLGSTNKGKEGI